MTLGIRRTLVNLTKLVDLFLADDSADWRQGKLHPSSDLAGCLRRTCLELAHAPTGTRPLSERTTMRVGTEMHAAFARWVQTKGYVFVEREVSGLGPQWRGHADLIFYLRGDKGFELADIKTTSGAAIYYANLYRESMIKEEHRWQVSAYYHGLRSEGVDVRSASILYWPVSPYWDRSGKKFFPEPLQLPVEVVSENELRTRQREVEAGSSHYLQRVQQAGGKWNVPALPTYMPPQEKLKAIFSGRGDDREITHYELYLQTPWQCGLCPFNSTVGGVCTPPQTKEHIGAFSPWGVDDWEFTGMSGYEEYEPKTRPRARTQP